MCRSANQLRARGPEACLRVVHRDLYSAMASNGQSHSIEIAVGSEDQLTDCIRPTRKRPPRPPKRLKSAQVTHLLKMAVTWRSQLDSGQIASQADLARREGVTRARVTQILRLLRLSPEIQRHILALPKISGNPPISERSLRPIAGIEDRGQQLTEFLQLIGMAQLPVGSDAN